MLLARPVGPGPLVALAPEFRIEHCDRLGASRHDLPAVGWDRPICPVSRRSRFMAFLAFFSRMVWFSFRARCEVNQTHGLEHRIVRPQIDLQYETDSVLAYFVIIILLLPPPAVGSHGTATAGTVRRPIPRIYITPAYSRSKATHRAKTLDVS